MFTKKGVLNAEKITRNPGVFAKSSNTYDMLCAKIEANLDIWTIWIRMWAISDLLAPFTFHTSVLTHETIHAEQRNRKPLTSSRKMPIDINAENHDL